MLFLAIFGFIFWAVFSSLISLFYWSIGKGENQPEFLYNVDNWFVKQFLGE